MSSAARIAYYLEFLFYTNQNGLTLKEIVKGVEEFEPSAKPYVEYELVHTMGFVEKPKIQQHDFRRPSCISRDDFWTFQNGRYFLNNEPRFQYYFKQLEEIRKGVTPPVDNYECEIYARAIIADLMNTKRGATLRQIIAAIKTAFPHESRKERESILLFAMGFDFKRPFKCVHLDRKSKENLRAWPYRTFGNWVFRNGKYYPEDMTDLNSLMRENYLLKFNDHLKPQIQRRASELTLWGQLVEDAKIKQLKVSETLMEYSFMRANLGNYFSNNAASRSEK